MKMKKNVFVLVLICCFSVVARAEVAKYCMTYTDFVNGNWQSVDSLTEGRTKQLLQMKEAEHSVSFKTGDKECDNLLKKQAFAVEYGNQLYVNCRNLRYKDVMLDISGYAPALRYDDNKLCVMVYKVNNTAFLVEIAADVTSIFTPDEVSIGLQVGSTALWASRDYLSRTVCYLIDSEANEKGKTAVKYINDEFMEDLLADDASLLERYKAVTKKRSRQSSANVLPVLMEKGIVKP